MATATISRVAVVDDDPQGAAVMLEMLKDEGYEGFHVVANNPTIDELVAYIQGHADAVICDHRLRYGGFADFTGSELAARLIDARIPTVVVTQYLDQEADVAIRTYRELLPVVLKRSEAEEPKHLRAAIEASQRELEQGRDPVRRPRRTVIRILECVELAKDELVIDAIVEGWNPSDAVRFPIAIVPEELRHLVKPGSSFTVDTNLGAQGSEELYFTSFAIAPEPDPDDGLA